MERSFKFWAVLVLLSQLAMSPTARADTVERIDGSVVDGKVVAETADAVTVETSSGGVTLRQKIARAKIRAVRKEVLEGPGYCTIPITGEIGADVTADDFKAALAEARRCGAQYVILVIDSPGGSVAEKNKILALLADTRDVKFVAHVKRAISAAAILAIACPHITMAPDATIGATVVYKVGPDGTPRNIEAKFNSIVRAQERAVAEMGGHSDLWARGMSETDLELHVVQEDGRPVLHEGPAPEGATVVKKKGQLLTLTAREALDAGLSNATTADIPAVRDALGLKAWHNAGDSPGQVMASRARNHAKDVAARDDKLKSLKPELAEIDAKLKACAERASAAESEMINLRTRFNTEIADLEAAYRRDMEAARARGGAAPVQTKEAARERAVALRRRYEADIAKQESIGQAALAGGRQLIIRRSQAITAALPNN